MEFITLVLTVLNVVAVLAIDIAAWALIGWQSGIAGLLGIIGFVLAYSISVEAALSPRDFFMNSEWGIFCKKLGWAWSVAGIIYALAYLVISYYFGDNLGIMPNDWHS